MKETRQRLSRLPPVKFALLAQELRAQTELLAAEPIAIIGMSCRFPGGINNPEDYWRLLATGTDAVGSVPEDRWDVDAYYDPDPDAPNKMYNSNGGFLNTPVDQFDAAFFGITPREAHYLDPQQRLLLELTWEALEHAGISPASLSGSNTGVFVGISSMDYVQRSLESPLADAYSMTGNAHSAAAGRLSYTLGLQGPCLAVDTACSSSLVALHLACMSLRNLECDAAVAGGVNLLLSPLASVGFSKTRMLSPSGRCHTFDAAADGYVRGEGCGMIVLKRLSDAIASDDRILAVVRGTAVNQDGRSVGLTVPNGPAQQQVIRRALAFVDPHDVDYIEAHGTGTSLGDPIEIHALKAVFGPARSKTLYIGSVKTNIGHLEAAAGVAGLIKVVLALQNEEIPPHLHLHTLNPNISFGGVPFIIPTSSIPWPRGTERRCAGVSSFGFTGTNAHVVLEEAPFLEPKKAGSDRPAHLLTISASNTTALAQLRALYLARLANCAPSEWADLCFTANSGRTHLPVRLTCVGQDPAQMTQQLSQARQAAIAGSTPPPVVFLFSGQGSQYVHMAQQLYSTEPVVRETLERCDAALRSILQVPLLEVLYQPKAGDLLERTAYAQPALFAVQWALWRMWRNWGVKPAAVIGHSIGEFAAACAAGVMEWESGLRLIARRAALMEQLAAGGEMWAVEAEERQVMAELVKGAEIGALNGDRRVVVTGKAAAVREVVARLERTAIRSWKLNVSHAFHSELMEPMLEKFDVEASQVHYRKPQLEWVSSMTGEPVQGAVDASYWRRQVREPVRFASALQTLIKKGYRVWLEAGPGTTLVGVGREHEGAAAGRWLPTLKRGRDDWKQTLESLGQLWEAGVEIDWKAYEAPYTHRKIAAPTYPFQRQRYWVPTEVISQHPIAAEIPTHPLLGSRLVTAGREVVFENVVCLTKNSSLRYLTDHQVFGKVIWPGTCFLEMALTAAEAFSGEALDVNGIVIREPMVLDPDESRIVQTVISPADERGYPLAIHSRTSEGSFTLHFTGYLCAASSSQDDCQVLSGSRERCIESLPIADLYRIVRQHGLEYGPSFQTIEGLWRGTGEAVAQIRPYAGNSAERYSVDPCLLDGCLQAIGAAVAGNDGSAYLPFGFESVHFDRKPAGCVWCVIHLRPESGKSPTDVRIVDALVFDEEGVVLGKLGGVSVKRAGREALERSGERHTQELLYRMDWEKAHGGPEMAGSRYLLIADGQAEAAQIAAVLHARGTAVEIATPEDRAGIHSFAAQGKGSIVFLAALDAQQNSTMTSMDLMNLMRHWCGGLMQTVESCGSPAGLRLHVVTRGAQGVNEVGIVSPAGSALWGLARVVALERPHLGIIRIDLDPNSEPDEAMRLIADIETLGGEDQIARRGGSRYVARLKRLRVESNQRGMALHPSNSGVLEFLEWREVERRIPAEGEVEVRVMVSGLNFRDVLCGLGMYSGAVGALGGEFSGRVVRVGPGVADLSPGDIVFGLGPGALGRYVTTFADLVVRQQATISAEEAATVPTAWLTAWWGLIELARLQPGERVLIHAGAGGVGMMAIQLAMRLGAEVWATAGSDAKRARLSEMGVRHIYNSRTLDFAASIWEETGGAGVHIVLNALSGDFIPATLSVMAPGGCFLEIGKRDIWSSEQMHAARPDVRYYCYDIVEVCAQQRGHVRVLMQKMASDIACGELKPLLREEFAIEQAAEAFRHMAQAKHIGKIVLRHGALSAEKSISQEGAFLVTGGLGALGLETARWLSQQGITEIVLAGRDVMRADTPEARDAISEMERNGCRVLVEELDVSDAEAVCRLVGSIERLCGVVHAAGVLDDALLEGQSWERMERVLLPKVAGAWNLHRAVAARGIDHFVLYGSVAGMIGSPGQANYAAANAFLGGLAEYRAGQGQSGLCIAWGPFAERGMATQGGAESERRRGNQGIAGLKIEEGMAALKNLMPATSGSTAVLSADWDNVIAHWPGDCPPVLLNLSGAALGPKKAGLLEQLSAVDPGKRPSLMVTLVQIEIAKVLGLDPANPPDPNHGFFEIGMDSLMAVEIRNRLEAGFACSLPPTIAFDCPNAAALANYLLERIPLHAATILVTAGEADCPTGQTPISTENIDDLSEGDLAQLLSCELSAGDARA